MDFNEWLKATMPHYPNNPHTSFPNWAMEAAFKAGRESLADELEEMRYAGPGILDMENYGNAVIQKLSTHSY